MARPSGKRDKDDRSFMLKRVMVLVFFKVFVLGVHKSLFTN